MMAIAASSSLQQHFHHGDCQIMHLEERGAGDKTKLPKNENANSRCLREKKHNELDGRGGCTSQNSFALGLCV